MGTRASLSLPRLTRRSTLGLGIALAACGREAHAPLEGGWIGQAQAVGHRLRDGPAKAAPARQRSCAVAIVGAGVAGLAVARALRRAGIEDFRVFELDAEAGGNARGHAIAGIGCPRGAHYLPLPGEQAHEVAELLHELGLLRSEFGRTVADERHLCHSPQERLWIGGQWIDGLLPPAASGSAREAQVRRFARRVDEVAQSAPFAIPTRRARWTAVHAALDAQTFATWLAREGFDDAGLRWYLDYACLDDYGADAATVSAWAGLHYFASRHGFHAPGDEAAERDPVFTWPEGNAWLTRRLAAPLGVRVQTDALVRRVEAGRHGVQIDVEAADAAAVERWSAQHAVVAVPLHAALRLIVNPPSALAAARVAHAPWLVANLHLPLPLTDKPGAPPSWDNVLDGSGPALGYVDATHQSLRPLPGPTVLTAYWALGSGSAGARSAQRRALRDQPWQVWAQRVIDDLARAHPDLPRKTARIDLVRCGHAMAIPLPGVRGDKALQALADGARGARLHFAHADLTGYSVFEEAFTLGDAVGRRVAAALRG